MPCREGAQIQLCYCVNCVTQSKIFISVTQFPTGANYLFYKTNEINGENACQGPKLVSVRKCHPTDIHCCVCVHGNIIIRGVVSVVGRVGKWLTLMPTEYLAGSQIC